MQTLTSEETDQLVSIVRLHTPERYKYDRYEKDRYRIYNRKMKHRADRLLQFSGLTKYEVFTIRNYLDAEKISHAIEKKLDDLWCLVAYIPNDYIVRERRI